MKLSLPARVGLLWALICAALIGAFGWLMWRGAREHLEITRREYLEHDARLATTKLQGMVRDAWRDALYLSRNPAVHEFITAAPTDAARWRRMAEDDFRALLSGKPAYFQVRLIGVADSGREVIRLDHNGGNIITTPQDKLQQKGDRDYFLETVALPAGSVFLSDLDLNRDFGRITEPYIPTLRAAAQVRGVDGALFGIVVINVDLRDTLTDLAQVPDKGVVMELANARGDFLIHHNAEALYGSDLQRPHRFSRGEPAARGELQWLGGLMLSPENGATARELSLRLKLPEQDMLAGWQEARNRAMIITAVATLLGAGAVAWFVGRILASNEAARRTAEQAASAREDFVARMSHEIRTPLNSVTGMLGVLERNRPAPHQEPVLRSLRAAARHLMGLLNDALDWSKIRAGMMDFSHSDFPLRELLDEIILTHRPQAMQKGLALSLKPDAALPAMINGDPLRLTQVLNNLLGNAVKFTTAGKVTLAAETRNGNLILTVTDTGPGIAPEEMTRMFDPYMQAGVDEVRRAGGTGLGLAIARQLVQMQGGTLEATSQQGQGSVFTVILPISVAQGAVSPSAPAPLGLPCISGVKILYVEDVATNREVMEALLEETGALLTMVGDGTEGLAHLQNLRPDIALLDLQLPDMSGTELAKKMAVLAPGLPMLAVTAQALPGTREECLSAGIQGIVTKPIDRDELIRAIASRNDTTGAPDFEELQKIFASSAARYQRVIQSLGEEFMQHRRTLTEALASGNITALRRLRHRMTTSLSQLKLTRLATAIDTLTTGEQIGRAHV